MTLELKKRTRWIIDYITEIEDLSNTKIGKKVGVKGDTVNNYRNMATDPKLKFIIAFCDAYDIDFLWFTKGYFSQITCKFPAKIPQFYCIYRNS